MFPLWQLGIKLSKLFAKRFEKEEGKDLLRDRSIWQQNARKQRSVFYLIICHFLPHSSFPLRPSRWPGWIRKRFKGAWKIFPKKPSKRKITRRTFCKKFPRPLRNLYLFLSPRPLAAAGKGRFGGNRKKWKGECCVKIPLFYPFRGIVGVALLVLHLYSFAGFCWWRRDCM